MKFRSKAHRLHPYSILLILFSFPALSFAQDNDLQLRDTGQRIENTIEMFMSHNEYQKIEAVTGAKNQIRNAGVVVNGDSIEVEDIHTRGQTTLFLRRKSFSFSLESKAEFTHDDRSESLKKFNAISLSMDKYYMRNRISFELMEELKLFGLFYTYSELKVNGKSEGIYLILERPQDWAMKKENSPLVIRRGYDHKIDKIKTDKDLDKPEAKLFRNYYSMIYRSLNHYSGEELYNALSQWIDLDMYMSWLAFNYFVRNGDYTDEVYFYISPEKNRFKIIPWDYDDVFASEPHEGMKMMRKRIGNKLIFSSEDQLDLKIADDPYLYDKYLIQAQRILSELSEASIKKVFESTYAELYPYYMNQEILDMNKHDAYKSASLESLHNELSNIYRQLVTSRSLSLQMLKSDKE